MAKIKLRAIFSLASGLGLAFSLPFFQAGWLVGIGLVPLLFSLASLKNFSSSFRAGYLTGFVYFCFAFLWFWNAYPLKTLGIDNPFLAFGLILMAWLATAGGMALFWGLIAGLFKKVEPTMSWSAWLIFPSVFTFFEYLRSFFLSLLWTAPGAVYGPHWTAGNLSYALSNSPVALFVSSLVGVYGLTFLIALVSVLIFLLLEHRQNRKAVIFLAIIIAGASLPFYGLPLPSKEGIDAAIIQTHIPSQTDYSAQEQLSSFRKQLGLLDKVSQQHPETDLVVFPEGSNFFGSLGLLGGTSSLRQYFDRLFPSSTVILDNLKMTEGLSFKSKTISLDSKKGITGFYDKRLLTPGGEYVPDLFRQVDRLIGLYSPSLQQAQEFSPGDTPPPTISASNFSFRPLICSDVSSPSLAMNNIPDLFTVQTSFGFVNGSSMLIAQIKAMARFRAAESQRALVFSSNFGPSFLLSPQGKVLQETKKPGFEILTGKLILNKSKSLYNKLGDGPMVMGSLSVLILSFFLKKTKENHEV